MPSNAQPRAAHVGLSPAQRGALTSSGATLGVRPEALHLSDNGDGIAAIIDAVEELGSDSFLYCTADSGSALVARVPGLTNLRAGKQVRLVPDSGKIHRFDTANGKRLPD